MSDLKLSVKDEMYLRAMDRAFDEKADPMKTLAAENKLFAEAAHRWCLEARKHALDAQRNRKAFLRATLLAAIGWGGLVAAGVWVVLRGQ